MRRTVLLFSLAVVPLLAWPARGEPSAKPAAADPAHRKLAFFEGRWRSEGEVRKGAFSMAGKITSSDVCEWFDGGFSLVCRSEGNGPQGALKGFGILGYDSGEGVYTYFGIDNLGATEFAKGKLEADTWTFSDESKRADKIVKSRYTIRQVSPTSYTFKWEKAVGAGRWVIIMVGKATKLETEEGRAAGEQ